MAAGDVAAAHLRLGVATLNKLRTYGGGPKFSKLWPVVVYDSPTRCLGRARKVRNTSEPVRAA